MNECLLMAYLRIKTNINKFVFTAHALPAVINATIFFFNHIETNKTAREHRPLASIFMHFAVRSFMLIQTLSRVIYDNVVHAIKQNLDKLCDFSRLRIKFRLAGRRRSLEVYVSH